MPSIQRASLRALLPGVVAGAFALPVLAAEADTPATVDSVIVTARPDPEDPAVVADARRRLSQTPGAVSVVSQESFASRQALALDDMLRDAPGVYAQRKWGGDIRISIRGSGIGNANHNRGLLIAQDGLPLNEADGYGDSQVADPLTTRFVEVWRGGNALRFGGALLGGAINMVTPTGRDAGFDNQIRIDGGSFGLLREHVALARQWGDWDAYAAATNQTGQGWRSQSQQNIQFATLNLGRTFGEDREVRFILNGANINQEIAGALTMNQFEADPRMTPPGNYSLDYQRNQRTLRGSLRTTWRLSDSTVFEGALYGLWKDLDHPIFQVIDQQSRNWGAFGRLTWAGEIAGMRADAYGGVWLRTGDMDSNFYVNLGSARGPERSRTLQNAGATDVFGEGRLFVADNLAVVAGATWGTARRDYESFALPGVAGTFNLKASKDYDWIAPRFGLLWESQDGVQVFANVTKSVEPPNFGAMSPTGTGFAPVEAQEAWTAEVGTRGRRGDFTWDVTLYRAWLDGEMLQYVVDNSVGIPASTFNADKTIHQGLEAALDWRFAKAWRLRQSWTWSDFRFDGDVKYGDNRLPIVPEHFYRAELRYDDPRGWFVAPSVEWSASDIWVDYVNKTRAPSYAILNLNAGWKVTPAVAVYVDARNLTDETYVSNVQAAITTTPAGTAAYWPGDGRSVYAGLTVAF
ncbi:TonB-dependent receptor family protein [Caulobacter mirabilis]|uniref:TonB-dependent receptor n=1 Tax=Caulobacter mirabilis TaxID=69666 RepID=A0A2D2ATE4_9CAUL|nr:TonB-dependent receptor [Caulobacter mirabilis]ATQ41269.1 TonB-dependent receptor [Caulobacter mirabilis]